MQPPGVTQAGDAVLKEKPSPTAAATGTVNPQWWEECKKGRKGKLYFNKSNSYNQQKLTS